ncbi:ABC transporter ATP-binding protein/permease [Arthrobacter bambusae]|jgi:ATP-binding cassette, subfamily B, multidrug efflux pump|uniref:ABC transporter ATP-binding protein n=1 Tax=Arthrobacter TaxID=1663 RepID=UPI000991444E|nr:MULTISPECIES: ABC transporter ATP-binding protein [Arthrobacter]MCI0143620.1 ABC transporter ATP-binding protein/permease [Arthrobacter bambusae]MDQ0210525.1 ATP-binding cassette subfamily B protein [Arthrobacter bambusae]MDQ0235197.1 ATP-binding cassette subfamily B protein [Arthrobacter bambusae]OOP61410.1 multidrug ABC transporter ATP-binding protein [Arthrobacter sp. SRS-W-1-2016]UYY81081.1 ABC transporter ATP-binding protein/permease [Arthrobacter sp. YA7-1]
MLWKLLVQYLRPHRRLLIAVVIFQLAQSIASLYLPTLNADIIDEGVAKGDTGYILGTGSLMLLITLLQITCSITAVYFGAKAAMGLGRDLRGAIFTRVGEFSEQEVTRFGAPSLITRSTNDVQQVQQLVLMSCTLMVAAPMLSIGGVIMAVRQDAQLSWLIAVSVPVLLVAVGLIVSRMVPLFRKMQVRIDTVNRVLREQLAGIRVVRAFVREDMETERFASANQDVTEMALRAGRLMALMFPVVMLVLNVSSVAVIWFGSFRIDDGSMQVGTLIAFLSYLMQILMSVMMATFMAVMIPRAAVSADRIGQVLETPSSVRPPENPVTETAGRGELELLDVGFAYPGAEQPVLSGISFRARAGQTTAIIGSTGAGKTTLVNLLPRLFDASSGSVRIDDVDVRELHPDLLWGHIGLVPQKPYLFSGTVRSNLLYGKPDATEEELWRALSIAQAQDFVEEMEGGLDAPISQGGTNVSGGQRQRLAIARALVKQPELYIFDDSFSSLDTATDARLRQALKRHTSGATMVIIAQRVSSIADAEQILVLDDGRLVGRGTHDELLETSETYREIVSSQLAAEEAA